MGRPTNTEVMLRDDAEKSRALALPTELAGNYLEDAGQGAQFSREDRSIPFINLVQQMSPELDDTSKKFLDGAKAGSFFNSVTREVFDGDKGVIVIQVAYEKVWNEWIPRDNGGGFVASYKTKEDAIRGCQAGNDIIETAIHYVLVQGADGAFRPALLSHTSTKLKVSRDWNALIADQVAEANGRKFTPPSFAMTYRMTSVKTKNAKGQPYHVPAVTAAGWVADADVYVMAKGLAETIRAGETRADFTKAEDTKPASSGPDEF